MSFFFTLQVRKLIASNMDKNKNKIWQPEINKWIKIRIAFDRTSFTSYYKINFLLTLWLVIAFESEMENVSTIESNRTSFLGCWAFFERGQSEHMAESVGVVGGIFDEYSVFLFHDYFLSFFPPFARFVSCLIMYSPLVHPPVVRVTFSYTIV